MCPELCVRKFVTSPVTQTCPISFSRRRRTLEVSSETLNTRRVADGGKSSPKSHWLCATLPIVRQRFRNALNAARAAGDFIDVYDCALQIDALLRHAKALWRMSD